MIDPTLGRNSDGTFAKGHAALNRPYRRYGETIRMLTEKYTAAELKALASDTAAIDEMTAIEAMAVRQLAMTLQPIVDATNADVRSEREALLDRLEGKPSNDTPENATGKLVINIVQFGDVKLPDAITQTIKAESDGNS